MPVSLLDPTPGSIGGQRVVHRTESTRSDKSDASAYSSEGGSSKKVSFNKAVRVKKYSSPPQNAHHPLDLPQNKFWFKVQKNHHQNSGSGSGSDREQLPPASDRSEASDSHFSPPDPSAADPTKVRPLSTITESSDTPRSTPPPTMQRRSASNSSRKRHPREFVDMDVPEIIVHKPSGSISNSPSVHMRNNARHGGNYRGTPPEPEVDYVVVHNKDVKSTPSEKKGQVKKNPIVNGVKVMFGMSPKTPRKKDTLIEETKIHSPYSSYNPRVNESVKRSQAYSVEDKQKNVEFEAPKNGNGKAFGNGNNKYATDRESGKTGMEVAIRSDSDIEEDRNAPHIISVDVWDSGQVLVSNTNNHQKSLQNFPGEGRLMSSLQEGSSVWKHKTRRKYYEDIKKDKTKIKDRASDASSPVPGSKRKPKAIEFDAKTDDDKLVTASELDEMLIEKKDHPICGQDTDFFPYLDSYIPRMEDKSTQCNLKKDAANSNTNTNRMETSRDASFRVIKASKDGSVSAFSDVPLLGERELSKRANNGEVIYSQVDKSKKKASAYKAYNNPYEPPSFTFSSDFDNTDYVYESNPTRHRTSSPSRPYRSPSPLAKSEAYSNGLTSNKTSKTTTKGYGFRLNSGVDGPEVKLPSRPSTPKMQPKSNLEPPEEWYAVPHHMSDISNKRNAYRQDLKRETIEETMSISNASSDEMIHHNQNTDTEDMMAPKSVIREIDHKKREISYENVAHNLRKNDSSRDAFEGASTNGGGLWFKSLDEDYRRGMVQSEVSYPGGNEPSGNTYSTLSRIDKKKSKRDYSPSSRHAFTLDKRYLEERKKRVAQQPMTRDISPSYGKPPHGRDDREARSGRDVLDTVSERYGHHGRGELRETSRFSSSRDLNNEAAKKGGLAAAYKARQQKRASSLNRVMGSNYDRYSPSLTGSQTHLHPSHGHSSSESEAGLRHSSKNRYHHENDPVVLYIPAVSHHNKKVDDDDDRLSGLGIARSQSILSTSKRSSKFGKKKAGKGQASASGNAEVTSQLNGYVTSNPSGFEDADEIVELQDEKDGGKKGKKLKDKDLKRRHSMPKDTKFPWLQKLRMRVKAREP